MNNIKNERFGGVYRNSRVLVTGHTGFKGSWLSSWLIKLGAKVIGISDCIPTNPSLFEILKLENRMEHHICDVRDADMVARLISEAKPDFVFHLAAQAIVSTSYHDPLNTISTNVLGTANVLEALRHLDHPCTAVFITSDKCYENVEWAWGYKETDHLGGRDIYSGSKGAAEVIFHSYFWSFFRNTHKTSVRIASGRAGNVIGGGDWAKDRIVVDCIRNWAKGDVVEIRSPDSTRPWQHVLEPLSGYLTLGAELSRNLKLSGESFNFGPRNEQNKTVVSLISELRQHWEPNPNGVAFRITSDVQFHEASLLRLNCDKAALFLKWEAAMNSANCIAMVGQWYSNYYTGNVHDAYELTLTQIGKYEDMAQQRGLAWTR